MQCWFSLSIIADFNLLEATTTEMKRCIQVSASSWQFWNFSSRASPPSPHRARVRCCVFHTDVQTWLIELCNILSTPEMFIPNTYYLPLCFGKGELLELNCWKSFYYFNYYHIILWSSFATVVEKIGFCCCRNKITTAIGDINRSYSFVSKEQHTVLYAEVKLGQLLSMFIISFKMRAMLG